MCDAMPISTFLTFAIPPVCFIVAIIVFFVLSSEEE